MRPSYRPYDETSFINARMKEKYSLVEVDLLVDTQSVNYFSSRGKQLAESANHENRNQFFNSDRMDKQTIASSNSSDGNRNFLFRQKNLRANKKNKRHASVTS